MNKDKLTNGQNFIYDKIMTDLKKQIADYSGKIAAVKEMKFYPKKDGTEKANFALNFGFESGENYTINWGSSGTEKRRCVTIVKKFNYQQLCTGVEFATAPIWDDKKEKQIIPYTSQCLYFNWDIFDNVKIDTTAKGIFDLIKGPYLDYLVNTCNKYNLALANFDDNFERLCIAATNLNENIKAISAPVFHSYTYNLQGRDNHYFVDNYFD